MEQSITSPVLKTGSLKLQRPSVYSFDRATDYFKAICEYKRSKNPNWSLGLWSRKLGVKGTGTISNFISGRRTPTPTLLERIRADLELSEYERIYFDALILSSAKTQNPTLKRLTRHLLLSEKTGEDYLEMHSDEFEAVADPFFIVLREAVKIEGFIPDPEWISKRFRLIDVSHERIQSALKSLVAVGLLKLDGERYIQGDIHFKTPICNASEAMKLYYENSLELNRRAVREIPSEERHLNSVTFCCEPEDLPELKEMIHAFSRKLMERFDRPKGNVVYQLHTQLLPHFETSNKGER